MGIIKDLWNLFVLLVSLTVFGSLGGITYKLGISALDLHQKGHFSLSKYNRMLVGKESLGR